MEETNSYTFLKQYMENKEFENKTRNPVSVLGKGADEEFSLLQSRLQKMFKARLKKVSADEKLNKSIEYGKQLSGTAPQTFAPTSSKLEDNYKPGVVISKKNHQLVFGDPQAYERFLARTKVATLER